MENGTKNKPCKEKGNTSEDTLESCVCLDSRGPQGLRRRRAGLGSGSAGPRTRS